MGTEARCAEILSELLGEEPATQDLLAKIAAGAVDFVPERVDACLAETAGCRWLGQLGTDPACRSVFEGEVPLGEPCERWEDCAGRAYCNHESGCPGVCTALGAPGATCEVDEDCDPGSGYSFCDFSGTEPVCNRLAYGAQAALDEDCTVSLEAASEIVQCASGLWCDPGDGTLPTGTCRSPIANGQPCDSPDDVCAGGDICLDDTSCELPQIAREAGDACDEAASVHCDPFEGPRLRHERVPAARRRHAGERLRHTRHSRARYLQSGSLLRGHHEPHVRAAPRSGRRLHGELRVRERKLRRPHVHAALLRRMSTNLILEKRLSSSQVRGCDWPPSERP